MGLRAWGGCTQGALRELRPHEPALKTGIFVSTAYSWKLLHVAKRGSRDVNNISFGGAKTGKTEDIPPTTSQHTLPDYTKQSRETLGVSGDFTIPSTSLAPFHSALVLTAFGEQGPRRRVNGSVGVSVGLCVTVSAENSWNEILMQCREKCTHICVQNKQIKRCSS